MKSIMLLQAPLGSFFQNLSRQLQEQGHEVLKVHFNGGDAHWPIKGLNYAFKGHPNQWEKKCTELIQKHAIDVVICYGDCRFYHKIAKQICQALNVKFLVLEEGYIRSNLITCELDGVNALSPLCIDSTPLWQERAPQKQHQELHMQGEFLKKFIYSSRYYMTKSLKQYRFSHYQHHRPWSFMEEAMSWFKSGILKYAYKHRDQNTLDKVFNQKDKKIFLFPLQVSVDAQIIEHSRFNSVFCAIERVLQSFLDHSPSDSLLIIKQHPMDRGHNNYRSFIKKWQKHSKRIFFVTEMNLKVYYKALKGVITVNSTVGLSAIHHEVPTLCLGKAIYAHEGLVTKGSVDLFWSKRSQVNVSKYKLFEKNLKALTQMPGSFYKNQSLAIKSIADKVAHLLL